MNEDCKNLSWFIGCKRGGSVSCSQSYFFGSNIMKFLGRVRYWHGNGHDLSSSSLGITLIEFKLLTAQLFIYLFKHQTRTHNNYIWFLWFGSYRLLSTFAKKILINLLFYFSCVLSTPKWRTAMGTLWQAVKGSNTSYHICAWCLLDHESWSYSSK